MTFFETETKAMSMETSPPSMVQTLLQLGELVFETDAIGNIAQLWVANETMLPEYNGRHKWKNIKEAYGPESIEKIKLALRQKKTQYLEYVSPQNKNTIAVLRFVHDKADKERAYIIVDHKQAGEQNSYLE